jgi:hypothetical protein
MTGKSDYYGQTGAMNSWERKHLGYIPSYFLAGNNGYTKTLHDYVETGDALQITIPYNSPTSTEYYLIENHQRKSNWDYIIKGGSLQGSELPNYSVGKGIYIWKVIGNTYPPNITAVTADGHFNWVYDGDLAAPGFYDNWVPKYLRQTVNRHAGISDRNPNQLWWPSHSQYAHIWCEKDMFTNNWSLTRDVMGDEYDAFNIGYNQLLTPWSNPSTTKIVNGQEQPTNISIELISQLGDSVQVKAYSQSSSGLALAPSKPQNLRLRGISYNHPVLVWEGNIEQDIAGYNIYRSENGGYSELIGYVPQTSGKIFTDYSANTSIPTYNYDYTIKAKDSTDLLSMQSDKVSIMALAPKISVGSGEKMPSEYILEQNYPNSFNPTTLLNYSVKEAGLVKIKVYDILGSAIAELVNEIKEAGYHSVEFNASNLPSGVYIYTLQVNGFSSSNKMLLLK